MPTGATYLYMSSTVLTLDACRVITWGHELRVQYLDEQKPLARTSLI